jgi:DNA-binding response OmpR family regulator
MENKKILIAEDDPNFGMMLKSFLEIQGFYVSLCENGKIALQTYKENDFDLCILDVMMPELDGFTLAENIKQSKKKIPFVFLTAKALKADQIKGYQLGASDYLVKPFDPEILLLKVNLLLSQNPNTIIENLIFELGSFIFDYEKRTLKLKEEEDKLSPKEAELLLLLCQKQGQVVTHEEALNKIWKNDDYFTKQSMNVFITKLRKYLSKDTKYKIEIENIHSKGFLLICT